MLKAGTVSTTEARAGDGTTALIAAGIGNNTRTARALVARRANIDAQNRNGERALSHFIYNGNRDAAIFLLNAGAEVNYADNDGRSPLLLAVYREDRVLAAALLNRKARVTEDVV